MGLRDRIKKRGGKKALQKRHNAGTKTTGGGRFPTIFLKDNIPEGVEFWRCKEGEHLADIIPFEAGADMPFNERMQPITDEGDLDYVLDLFVHTNVGAMNKPYVCPYENFGEPCPICEFIKANQLEKEDWKKLVAKHRVVYLLWVHDSREEEKKSIQIFEASHFFMEEKIQEIAKLPRGGGFENFSDPDNGKTLAWKRKGSGMENTQYLGHRFIDRDSVIPDRILDKSFSLDSVVNMHPEYEEIEREFRGTLKKMNLMENDEEDDDSGLPDDEGTGELPEDWDSSSSDEEKAPRPRRRKRPSSRKKRPPKDEEEEETPRTRTRKRPSGKKPSGKKPSTTSGKSTSPKRRRRKRT